MNTVYSDWQQVPNGLILIRMFHESLGAHCLHLHLKLSNGPWYNNPRGPASSEHSTAKTHADFWEWAKHNLPIYNYPKVVQSSRSA